MSMYSTYCTIRSFSYLTHIIPRNTCNLKYHICTHKISIHIDDTSLIYILTGDRYSKKQKEKIKLYLITTISNSGPSQIFFKQLLLLEITARTNCPNINIFRSIYFCLIATSYYTNFLFFFLFQIS
jgi:hypothetical protein